MEQIARTEKQLGAQLRRFRKAASLSQAQIGLQTGKRQATLSSLEGGAGGTLETFFAVLNALDLEMVVRPRSKGGATNLEDIF